MDRNRTKLDRFDGGMVNPFSKTEKNTHRVIQNFDALTNPGALTPYRSYESGDDNGNTSFKKNFCVAKPGNSASYQLYSLGLKSGGNFAEILVKSLSTGSTQDLTDNSWTTPNNNQSGLGVSNPALFVPYKTKIYGVSSAKVWSFDRQNAWVEQAIDLSSVTNLAQGLVHSKDDILYIPYDNKIATMNDATPNATALTLPSYLYITSIAEFGNYLAIACAPLSGYGNSKVFLWDRDSSINTISEVIDWGEGILKVIEEVDGVLIGISIISGSGVSIKDRVIFRHLDVSSAVKFKEITGTTGTQLPIAKQKVNGRLFFMMGITIGGTDRKGLWSIGRTPGQSFSLVQESTLSNDDSAITAYTLYNFIVVGDFKFISFLNSTSTATHTINKTDDQANYSTGVFETNVFDDETPEIKQIQGITVHTDAIPSGGSVVVKYKKDEDCDTSASWNTLFTVSTEDAVKTSKAFQNSGNLPKYTQIQYRLESVGGAIISGLEWESRKLKTKPY